MNNEYGLGSGISRPGGLGGTNFHDDLIPSLDHRIHRKAQDLMHD